MDEWLDLAIMGVGAGAKGLVTGLVGNFLPGVSEDIGALIAGGLLYYLGPRVHPLLRKFGAGVLIGAIGQLSSGWISGLVPGGQAGAGGSSASSGGSSASSAQYASLEAMAMAEAQKPVEGLGVLIS